MKIVTLTLCAAFDIHASAASVYPNRENAVRMSGYDAGGKGVNISRALCRFGVDNTAVVAVGEDNGDEYVKILENENICLQTVKIPGRIRENITIHTDDGKETRISFSGDDAPRDLLKRLSEITDAICDNDTVLTFCGRLPSGVSVEDAKTYIKKLEARGVRVVIDSKSFSLSDIVELRPFLIKPNEEEIYEYTKSDVSDIDLLMDTAIKLNGSGIENVMISLGARGALLCTGGKVYFSHAPSVEAVSTIGAGDSSIAGFLYALSEKKPPEECLKLAVAFGSAACLTAGTNPPDPDDINNLIKLI